MTHCYFFSSRPPSPEEVRQPHFLLIFLLFLTTSPLTSSFFCWLPPFFHRGTPLHLCLSVPVGPGFPSASPLGHHVPQSGLPARPHPGILQARSAQTVAAAQVREKQKKKSSQESSWPALLFSVLCTASRSRWPTPCRRHCGATPPMMKPKLRQFAACGSPLPASSLTRWPRSRAPSPAHTIFLSCCVRFERRKQIPSQVLLSCSLRLSFFLLFFISLFISLFSLALLPKFNPFSRLTAVLRPRWFIHHQKSWRVKVEVARVKERGQREKKQPNPV